MLDFSLFKFYRSFNMEVEKIDDLRSIIQREDNLAHWQNIEDTVLLELSIRFFKIMTKIDIQLGCNLSISLQFKKYHIDLNGKIVKRILLDTSTDVNEYIIEIEEDQDIVPFFTRYISSFSIERIRNSFMKSFFREKMESNDDQPEVFSLFLSFFREFFISEKKENIINEILEDGMRNLGARRGNIFLINPETNQLELNFFYGQKLEELPSSMDYREGIPGLAFVVGRLLNVNINSINGSYSKRIKKILNSKMRSAICYPILNKEEKIIGILEFINKRETDQFTSEDEEIIKVLSLLYSSIFSDYNPILEKSLIDNFSKSYERKLAFVGTSSHIKALRRSILKLKNRYEPLIIYGEAGVGKNLFAHILHSESIRGKKKINIINGENYHEDKLWKALIHNKRDEDILDSLDSGTLTINNIDHFLLEDQEKLYFLLTSPYSYFASLDVRVITLSTRDICCNGVDQGFHKNLYEYLSTTFLYIEPLRKRSEDVEDILNYFLKKECTRAGVLLKSFSSEAIGILKSYDWPGNIQELKQAVRRAVIYGDKRHIITADFIKDDIIQIVDIFRKKQIFGMGPYVADHKILLKNRIALIEREMILSEIKRNNGNKSKASKEMGISREALRKKLIFSDVILENLDKSNKIISKKKKSS